MPYFLDEFVGRVRDRRDCFLRFLGGVDSRVKLYGDVVHRYWNRFPELGEVNAEVLAIDSSDAVIECKGGVLVYVCRGLGVSNRGGTCRDLGVEVFFLDGGDSELSMFRGLYREYLEHLVALKSLDMFSGVSRVKAIFIDGSLYGRMVHLVKDIDIAGKRDFMMDYVEVYAKLLREAYRKGVTLIGVSKDSRSRLLRRYMLTDILSLKLQNLDIPQKLREKISMLWGDLWRRPRQTLRELYSVRNSIPPDVYDVFIEATYPRPDIQLLIELIGSTGYSTPLLLSPLSPLAHLVTALRRGRLLEYIRRNFTKAIVEKGEETVLERGEKVLLKVLDYPYIASFYVLFRDNDIPLRIDFPVWTIKDVGDISVLKDYEESIRFILGLIYPFYSGPKHYNVLLEHADLKVKMKDSVKNIYERVLEREIEVLMEHSRGVRRVRYP